MNSQGWDWIPSFNKKWRIIVIVRGEAELHHFRKWQIIVIPRNYAFPSFPPLWRIIIIFLCPSEYFLPVRYSQFRINCQNKRVYLPCHFILVTNFYSYDMRRSVKVDVDKCCYLEYRFLIGSIAHISWHLAEWLKQYTCLQYTNL
jgi:hypothetical protein